MTVAITGMSCLFPGAPSLDAYWRNILGKVDATSDPPPESWDPDVYYDPEFANPDSTYCKRGGYLGSLATFDPLAHGIPPVAVGGEPDQWLALQVASDALADASATDLPEDVRRRTAIVLGKGTYLNGGNAIAVQRGLVIGQTLELIHRLHPEHSQAELEQLREEMQRGLPPLGPDTVPGLIPNIIVGRIANRLDFMGPTYTVDGACASSLLAVRHAVRDLLAGECDLALAGGAQVWMPVATLNLFCRLGALSRRQQLRPFDKDADGTLLGEGIGMVVLKRLDDAVRDGDRVYAVIRGIGVASDGRGMSVMAPRVEGEELALRRAYAEAGVPPTSVGLIEAHGTGTPVGDAVEIDALTRVFGEREGELPRCAVGSVKSMISHTIPAAGVAGLIKTALALYHRVLPPSLHCDEPNPSLGLGRTPFYINTETRPWIHGGAEPRRAGVNAFGFGGINAHAVLEEFHVDGADVLEHRPPWDTELFLLESDSAEGLADAAAELAAALEKRPAFDLTNLAYSLSLGLGRVERPMRLAIVASSLDDLAGKLAQAVDKIRRPDCRRIKSVSGIYYDAEPLGRDGKVALVFPGEGAQYPNMVGDLCLHFAEAREVFDRIDRLYAGHPRGDLLSDWVFPRPSFTEAERRRADERLMQLDIAVESVLTANAALYAVVSRLLPRSDAVVGHSTGEHSAALVTGVLDVSTDERLVAFSHGLYRAYADAASRHDVRGAVLLAVGADAARAGEIAAEAGGELHLAMDNCPHQAVLVGEPEAAARALEIAAREGLVCDVLPYDRPVHTPLFAPFADDLRAVFRQLPVRAAAAALWSCTTAAPFPDDAESVRELLVEHWTSPVRFGETIEALYADGARVFVEVGPRGNLTTFVEDILRGRRCCAVAADVQRRSGVTQLNHLAGLLAVHEVEVDVGYLFRQRCAREIDWRAPGDGPDGNGTRAIPLSTSWPMLRLSPEVVERLRPAAPVPATAALGEPQEPHHTPPAAAALVEPPEPHATLPATAALVEPPEPHPTLPAPFAGDGAGGHTGAVNDHLRTMERFLDAGRKVMEAYLAAAPPYPLLGEVVAQDPGAELVARRLFDPTEDRYLLDHTLGRVVSRSDPELHALAVMPLAMSLEILAEAAAALIPGRIVTGLRDVYAHRWLTWGEEPQTLEVTARVTGTGQVRAELRAVEEGADPCVEGTVLVADGYAPPPAPLAVPLDDGGRPSRYEPGGLYGEDMFHGPAWQAVRAVDVVAPGAALARLDGLPRTGMLAGDPDPQFVLDPVVLDAAGQVIGFWAADLLDRARVVFPFRVAALDVYGPQPLEPLTCTAAIELVGDALVRSDIDVLDRTGRPWMRISGWQDKRFDVPERFRPLTRASGLAPLSRPWKAPVEALPGVACRRLDSRLPSDGALWKPVWAGRVLGRRERERFAALRAPERRQLEWLGVRTAAKEAVAELLERDLLPADIEILPDDRGGPRVTVAGLEGPEPIVSLAHADGEAVAVAALGGAGIGIDIEPVKARPPGFAEAALTPEERRLLPVDGDDWLLRCWCAKEAAGKAFGSGLAAAPAAVGIDPERQEVVVEVSGHRIVAHTRRDDDLVVATAIWEAP